MKKLEFKELKKKLPKGINLIVKKKLSFKVFNDLKKNYEVKGRYDLINKTIYLTEDANYWTFYHERLHSYIDKYFWKYFGIIFYWIEEVIVALITGIVKYFNDMFKGK